LHKGAFSFFKFRKIYSFVVPCSHPYSDVDSMLNYTLMEQLPLQGDKTPNRALSNLNTGICPAPVGNPAGICKLH